MSETPQPLPRLVVFDLAGTTVEDRNAVGTCLREALAGVGLAVDLEAVNRVMGLPKPEAIRLLVQDAGRDELFPQLTAIYDDFLGRMTAHYRESPEVREVRGTSAVFEALHHAGVRIGLDTGFSRAITDVLLDRMGWFRRGLADASVASDEVPRGRPHPDMVYFLMQRLGIGSADEVAKVGDTPSDIDQGRSAGCGWVIGVTGGTHSREQLASRGPTHLIETVAELPRLFGLG